MSKIKVVVKEPFQYPKVMEIEDALESYQKLVDGYIETVPFNKEVSIIIIVNEEGKLKGLRPNIPYGNDILVGTIVFVGNDAPNFRGLTDAEVEEVKNTILKGEINL